MYNEAQPQLQPQRKRGRANYDKQFLYSKTTSSLETRLATGGGGGDTHKRTQPLLHKSFPYWHDWHWDRRSESDGWGGAGSTKQYRETSSEMPWGLGHRGWGDGSISTTATSEENEVTQSLRPALLAGKVEASGQSSQSKCESWRLKGHFPSSSPMWRGATWRQWHFEWKNTFFCCSFFSETTESEPQGLDAAAAATVAAVAAAVAGKKNNNFWSKRRAVAVVRGQNTKCKTHLRWIAHVHVC